MPNSPGIGYKIYDSLQRRAILKGHDDGINEKCRFFCPLRDWTNRQVKAYAKAHALQLAPEYSFGATREMDEFSGMRAVVLRHLISEEDYQCAKEQDPRIEVDYERFKDDPECKHLQNASTVKILRSQIDTDDFNPRDITPENKKRLRQSIESFGLIGAPIYNRRTHHVVGGHQRLSALDAIMNRADYELDVIEVDMSEKDEVRLNVALNNPDLQGTYNFAAIDQLCKEMGLDPENDCLFSPEMVAVEFPDFTHSMEGFGSVPKKEVSEEEQKHYRAERERMRTRQKERENELGGYNIAEQKGVITVVFRTESEKREFLESVGQDPDRNAINFEEFRRMLS